MKKNRRIPALLVVVLALCLCACGSRQASAVATEMPAVATAPVPAEASAAPENLPVYDLTAYEAAVQEVRDEYIQVTREGIDSFEEAEHPELPWYTAVMTRYPENRYYEAYYDFDGNGVPELMIAVGNDDYLSVIAVYAFDGQHMHYLCKEHPLGERSHLSHTDGLFVVHGSGGASSGILAIYRIAEDGWSTDLVDVVDYQYSSPEHVIYTPKLGNISAEEIVSRGLVSSFDLDIEPDWHCFYPQ